MRLHLGCPTGPAGKAVLTGSAEGNLVLAENQFGKVFRPYLAILSDEAAKPGGAAP